MGYYEDLKLSVKDISLSSVAILPITPWGHFTFALNASISFAIKKKLTYIAFQVPVNVYALLLTSFSLSR